MFSDAVQLGRDCGRPSSQPLSCREPWCCGDRWAARDADFERPTVELPVVLEQAVGDQQRPQSGSVLAVEITD